VPHSRQFFGLPLADRNTVVALNVADTSSNTGRMLVALRRALLGYATRRFRDQSAATRECGGGNVSRRPPRIRDRARSATDEASAPVEKKKPPAPESPAISLEQLLEEHREFVRRSLGRAGVPPAAVDDAAQQVFLVVANKLSLVDEARARSFLLGISLNVAAHARRGAARRREVDDDAFAEMFDDAPLPDEALDAQRLSMQIEELVAALPIELRTVLVLIDIEERTMAEAAEQLAIPPGTVASRLRRAREMLAMAVARVRPSRRLRAARRRSP
jgi:RNA polymerase sigma-70 factor (ECF subfamily)